MENNQKLDVILNTVGDKTTQQKIEDFFSQGVGPFAKALSNLENKILNKEISLAGATKEYTSETRDVLKQAEKLETELKQKILIKKIKEACRSALANSPVYKSLLIKRAYEKPRGYPGDYQMLEYIYDNKPISKDIGYCGDEYILQDDYVIAVRSRKDMMQIILRDYIKNAAASALNILNLGCGSCRELKGLFAEGSIPKPSLTFNLVDQDEEALDFCKKNLSKLPSNLRFNFFQENIVSLSRDKKYCELFQGQDLIYSIGLADYLPDMFLGSLMQFCFQLLKPQGKLVIAHKNVIEYKASAPDWFCEWYFFPRGKEKLSEIVKANIGDAYIDYRDEESKRIFFVIISKR